MELFNDTTGLVTSKRIDVGWDHNGVKITIGWELDEQGQTIPQWQRVRRLSRTTDSEHWYLVELRCGHDTVFTVHRDEWNAFEGTRQAAQARVAQAAEGITEEWHRIPAREQHQRFGGAPFGKREVRHRPGLGFDVKRIVAFGQDYNIQFWSYLDVAALLANGETVVGKRD